MAITPITLFILSFRYCFVVLKRASSTVTGGNIVKLKLWRCVESNEFTLTNQLCGTERYFRGHQLCSHSMRSQHFIEPEGSLPHSQELSICTYPEPNKIIICLRNSLLHEFRNLKKRERRKDEGVENIKLKVKKMWEKNKNWRKTLTEKGKTNEHILKVYGDMEVQLHYSRPRNSAISDQLHVPTALTLSETIPLIHCTECWVGCTVNLEAVE
jgi:hypothetical protein